MRSKQGVKCLSGHLVASAEILEQWLNRSKKILSLCLIAVGIEATKANLVPGFVN